MDIEKAIERLSSHSIIPFDNDAEEVCNLAIQALEKQKNNGWIPVSVRLPAIKDGSLEYSELCLVTANINMRTYTYLAYYGSCNGFTGLFGGDWNNHVTAWMPLPDPYRGDER